MKRLLTSACILSSFVSSPVLARDMSDISVGDYVCYNRFGPLDVFGTVISKDYAGGKVELRKVNGGTGTYSADKITSPTYCEISSELQEWALKQGYNLFTGEKQ